MDARGGGAAAAAALFDADAGSGFSVRGVRARCEEEEEEEDLDVDDPPRLRPTVNAVGFTIWRTVQRCKIARVFLEKKITRD
jgi:hypothetical protein